MLIFENFISQYEDFFSQDSMSTRPILGMHLMLQAWGGGGEGQDMHAMCGAKGSPAA